MPQRIFYTEKEKHKCLSASWENNWSNLQLRYQGELICYFATRKELVAGRQFVMPDGHLLSVRLKHGLKPELELLRDGLPVLSKPESVNHTGKTIFQLALFLGVLNIAAGTMAAVTQSDIMLSIGFGYVSVAVGAAYLLLAWGIRRFSTYAVVTIAALFSIDIALIFLVTAMLEGPSSPVSGLLLKLFLLYAFVKGRGAIKKINSQAAANTSSRQSIN